MLGGVALAVTKTCTTKPREGTGGPDTLIGNASKNQIYGRSDADNIAGRAAADRLHGNRGNDEVWGEGGADFIDGGMHSDSDRLYGGSGNDTIRAVDELNGWEDYIDCGDGTDTAYVDEPDVVENCETVFRTPPEEPPCRAKQEEQERDGEEPPGASPQSTKRDDRDAHPTDYDDTVLSPFASLFPKKTSEHALVLT